MAHESQSDIGRKVWQNEYWGPDGAVVAGRRRYEKSGKAVADRIAWMSTAYSALNDVRPHLRSLEWLWIRRLLQVLGPWLEQVRYFYGQWDLVAALGYSADQAETVSRNLLGRSRLPLRRVQYRRAASYYATYAYELAVSRQGGHTAALAANTLAEIAFLEGRRDTALNLVDEAARLASGITSLNQKARVYRQLAILAHRFLNDPDEARELLDLADMPGIDPDVRIKNAETRKTLGL